MRSLTRILPLRLPLKISKITINAANKRKRFSKPRKTRIFAGSINAVFIHKEIKFKKYEKQKNKKNIGPFKSK